MGIEALIPYLRILDKRDACRRSELPPEITDEILDQLDRFRLIEIRLYNTGASPQPKTWYGRGGWFVASDRPGLAGTVGMILANRDHQGDSCPEFRLSVKGAETLFQLDSQTRGTTGVAVDKGHAGTPDPTSASGFEQTIHFLRIFSQRDTWRRFELPAEFTDDVLNRLFSDGFIEVHAWWKSRPEAVPTRIGVGSMAQWIGVANEHRLGNERPFCRFLSSPTHQGDRGPEFRLSHQGSKELREATDTLAAANYLNPAGWVDGAIQALSDRPAWGLFELPTEHFGGERFEKLLRVLDEHGLIQVHVRRFCGPNGWRDDREPQLLQLDQWFGPGRWYSPNRRGGDGYTWTALLQKYSPESKDSPLVQLSEKARARVAELALGTQWPAATQSGGASQGQGDKASDSPPANDPVIRKTELIVDEGAQTIAYAGRKPIRIGGSAAWGLFILLWKNRPNAVEVQRTQVGSAKSAVSQLRKMLRDKGLDDLAAAIKTHHGVGYFIDI